MKRFFRGVGKVLYFLGVLTVFQITLGILIGVPWYVADRYGWPGIVAAIFLWGVAGAIAKAVWGDPPSTGPY